jgi:hypothetical protein
MSTKPDASETVPVFRVLWTIVAAIGVLVVPIIMLFAFPAQHPEVQLGLVIVFGVVLLMVLLFIMAMGFRWVDLSDDKQALGLPEGTIRALIALILILLFVIVGIYLFRVVGEGETTLRGLSRAEVTALGNRVVESTEVATNVFDVKVQDTLSEDGGELAQQLLTTIGTLVVAVAGFYFGASAVTGATKAIVGAQVPTPTITTPTPLPAGQVNQPYTTTLQASGGKSPYKWGILPGYALPQGLVLDPTTGIISGTPTTAEATTFHVVVLDADQEIARKQLTLTIT